MFYVLLCCELYIYTCGIVFWALPFPEFFPVDAMVVKSSQIPLCESNLLTPPAASVYTATYSPREESLLWFIYASSCTNSSAMHISAHALL